MTKRLLLLCLLIAGLLGVSDVKATDVYYLTSSYDETTGELTETKTNQASATDVSKSTTELSNGNYYYVSGAVTISDRVTVTGNVTLILADDAELTCSVGIDVQSEGSLTITVGGESKTFKGTGTLAATVGEDEYGAGIDCDNSSVTISGGKVTATGSEYAAGIDCDNSSVTISGGKVTATGQDAAGIDCDNSSVTISWRRR